VDIHETDASQMVAYRRGVRRPQFFAVVFRALGILVVAVSFLGMVVEAVTAGDAGLTVRYLGTSLVSGLLLLAISVFLDWCAVLVLTLRYGAKPEE
jgi:hypothetical protein